MTAPAIEIVPYRPEHAEAWRSLNTHWILAGGYAIDAKDELVLSDAEGAILSKGGTIFIAESDGEAVGCCSLMALTSQGADGGFEVGKMAVDEAAQGRGLGYRLLEACEAAARAAGAPRLYLETNAAQTTPSPCTAASVSSTCRLSRRPTPAATCGWRSGSRA